MRPRTKRHRHPLERSEDHVHPRARGGGRLFNIVHCHRKCNEEKGALTLEQYREVIAMRQRLPVAQFRFPGETDEWIAYQKLVRSHPLGRHDENKLGATHLEPVDRLQESDS